MNLALVLRDVARERLDGGRIVEIDRHEARFGHPAQLFRHRAAALLQNVGEHEASAGSGAGVRDRAADAARGAGDDDGAPGEHAQTAVRTEDMSSASSCCFTRCDSMRRMRATPTSCW